MKFKNIIVLVPLILFLSAISHAQNERPQVPYIQHDICPFECCQYGKWIAKSPLKAYKKEGDDASIAFTIKPGEEFSATSGNVHIMKLGIITITKSFNTFTKGDKVYMLSYRGEGAYDLWYKGKMLDLDLDSMNKVWTNGTLIQLPEFVWWVLVKNKDGNIGWLRLRNISESGFWTDEKIEGLDSCS
jgi:hypothetical protein